MKQYLLRAFPSKFEQIKQYFNEIIKLYHLFLQIFFENLAFISLFSLLTNLKPLMVKFGFLIFLDLATLFQTL
jgi:hypothetical protein